MNVKYMFSLIAVLVLFLLAYFGVAAFGLKTLFGVVIPYVAITIFIVGIVVRMIRWAKSPVPFQIPTTCGQHKSLTFLKQAKIDNPSTKTGVIARVLLEVTVFRSLFRNTRMKLHEKGRLAYSLEIFLWLGALAFHWAFFAVIFRHLRLFLEPMPQCVKWVEYLDSFFRLEVLYDAVQIGVPAVFLSGLILFAAVTYLLLRRMMVPNVRYISLAADYFPLFLIFGIALSGLLMRYITKINVVSAKTLGVSLTAFAPVVPADLPPIFFVHLFFVCVLLMYFPFSKLLHAPGVFFSPTRNMTTNTREVRHINPWNYPVKIHTYEEYEDDYREKMVEAGIPVDKEPEMVDEPEEIVEVVEVELAVEESPEEKE